MGSVVDETDTEAVEPPGRPEGAPAAEGGSRRLFVLRIGGEDQVAHGVLCVRVGDGPEQGEAASLTVHRVLAGRERDVARGGADLEPLGGARPVAVVPLERREDVPALHVPQRTHVL